MQASRISGTKGGGFHHIRGHHVMPSASFRTFFEASRRGFAHGLHEIKKTGHRPSGLQRGTSSNPPWSWCNSTWC